MNWNYMQVKASARDNFLPTGRFKALMMAFLLVCSWTTVPAFGQNVASVGTEQKPDTLVAKNPTGAMIRSLMVPGWGQFYNGKWLKGLAIAGAEIGLVTNALVLNQWASEAQTELDKAYYIDNRNLSYWILGAVILYSMADAYVDAALADFDESPELGMKIDRQPALYSGAGSNSYSIEIAWHF